jgi:SAM-dependent methyltransferase
MAITRQGKYRRFRDILKPPYNLDETNTFPIYATDTPFNLKDYAYESANPSVDTFDNLAKALPDELFMDLGCGRREVTLDNVLYVEVYPSVSADLIVAADCTYPIRDSCLRGIGCFAVLEHTRQPWRVVQEMRRMLKPGGQVFIDWPFLQPVHGYPSHFFNATREGLTSIFEDEGFTVDQAFTGHHQTAAYSLQWLLGRFAHHLKQTGDHELLHEFAQMTVSDMVSMSQQDPRWWKFLNALPPAAFAELACGNMLFATKTI